MSTTTPIAVRAVDADDLQKANEVIGQFITSCSHSMRGPLKTIVGLVNLLQNPEAGTRELDVFLSMIRKNTDRMEHMLDEMEYFLENAQRKVKTEVLNSREAIEDLLKQQRDTVESAGATYVTSVKYLAPCFCDKSRLMLSSTSEAGSAKTIIDSACR